MSEGKGTINNIPTGSKGTLTLQGLDISGSTIYVGASTNLTISAGQTADAGTITMAPADGGDTSDDGSGDTSEISWCI